MTVLCVDSAEDARRDTESALSSAGFDVTGCASLADARDILADDTIDAVVTDYHLPDGTGLDIMEYARETTPDAICVLFTEATFDEIDTAALGDLVAEYVDAGAPDADETLVDLLEHSITTRSQTAYPLPDDEDERLEAVERYVADIDALDESLDRLTRIATALFDVDSSGVGFMEAHHERFAACHGADFDTIDREDTICTYTILDDGVTVVSDTQDDPRFDTNEGIIDTGIRFYAGAPVRTSEGDAIGVFCLYDTEPRTFSDRDRQLLTDLADEAMVHLELGRQMGGDADA